ncbi:hypothetical protein BCU85_20745 [Vibrio lentus]|uniref:hypothetical protein n=1 Tax=Vibrio lentus TaxID=136468 RepID=UPI000C84EA41|nr:hypothetical protein [Vibrio lentus]MCC4819342.1 hypothetical protein [Vibrio lentus]PMG72017.1 hypothetical protein BCU85_20745 [Vibrio lentus]PMK86331.1 hypothetical protein BCT88_12085 [Vibrio lentus]PML21293.1 hypothetical protein BCT80_15690 [Vibrio lentus]PMM24005.1 hypothetical protein BCT57_08405 [Vibrio lentus]
MIINDINLSHVQQNSHHEYYLNDVLEAIYTQREEAYQAAFLESQQLHHWLSHEEVNRLTSAFDKQQEKQAQQDQRQRLAQERHQKKLLSVQFGERTMTLFTFEQAMNQIMSVSEFKDFIESIRHLLGVYDLEQAQAVLYQIALSKSNQIRVFNHV